MDYLYSRIEDARFSTCSIERKAFAAHLKLVAKALHDIEWVDSADFGEGDENAAIRACLHPSQILEVVIENAILARTMLSSEIEKAHDSKVIP